MDLIVLFITLTLITSRSPTSVPWIPALEPWFIPFVFNLPPGDKGKLTQVEKERFTGGTNPERQRNGILFANMEDKKLKRNSASEDDEENIFSSIQIQLS
jgi:hypothetical protein